MVSSGRAVQERLRNTIVHVTDAFEGIAAVYLFGSHAERRAHRESDVDVGVLLDRRQYPTPAARFDIRVRLAAALTGALAPADPDVVVLNDAPPTLAAAIVTRGHRLACAAPDTEHAFRRDVQLRAADLQPFLRRTRRVKLETIARR